MTEPEIFKIELADEKEVIFLASETGRRDKRRLAG